MTSIADFSRRFFPRYALRPYQCAVAREIIRSVRDGRGRQFAVVFARQSGKDEMLAQIEAYLMWLFNQRGGSIVVATPTYRPQGLIARRRLLDPAGRSDVRGHGELVASGNHTPCPGGMLGWVRAYRED